MANGCDNVLAATTQPQKVEVIPPQRRLEDAPVERMLEAIEPQIVEPEPHRCKLGPVAGECHVMEIGKNECEHW